MDLAGLSMGSFQTRHEVRAVHYGTAGIIEGAGPEGPPVLSRSGPGG